MPGEEVISAPDDVSYGAGVLVLVDLSAAKQIQRHAEAGRQLVSILQNFSRLQEKSKNQEEEIEQWKQSLTYQSQELNRREMEMEARQEQLEQLEEDFEKLEQQRQEIATAQSDLDRLREEYERKSQELEGAWAQLRGAENRLEERQSELQQSSILDERQSQQLQDLLGRISGAVPPTESVHQRLHASSELMTQQQGFLGQHWQHLEQHRNAAQQLQSEVDRQTQELLDRWQVWHQACTTLSQTRAELAAKQQALQLKQNARETLAMRLQAQEALYQQVVQLAGASDPANLEALENLPLEQLQNTARELEQDLEKLSRFVHSQEEELSLQQQDIDNLRQQIQQANEYDRLRLETELAEEQDCYQMLNQTLIGQRRNLLERQTVLKQHQRVLSRRQGYPVCKEDSAIDLTLILTQLDQLRQQLSQELQTLEQEMQGLQATIGSIQATIEQNSSQLNLQQDELRQLDQQVRSQIAAAAELWGRVNVYQEALQPLQNYLNGLQQETEIISSVMAQFQETSDDQLQAVHEMQATIQHLTQAQMPELVAS